jgi:hypothetical protein
MATFNFPSSPNVGQLYTVGTRTWIWNGIAWATAPFSGGGTSSISVQSTAPQSPKAGDLWYDTNVDGGLFVYYQDLDSSQWIQAAYSTGFDVQGQDAPSFDAVDRAILPLIDNDNNFDIGSTGLRFKNLFLGGEISLNGIFVRNNNGKLGVFNDENQEIPLFPSLDELDALSYKGVFDASPTITQEEIDEEIIDVYTYPNYPAGNAGHVYKISSPGKIGGTNGINVEAGDMLICGQDNTPSGTQEQVGQFWNIIQSNIDNAVIGPSETIPGYIVSWNNSDGTRLGTGYNTTGTGDKVVLSLGPTLVDPILGNATLSSINKIDITPVTNGSSLTIADGKDISINNSLTFAGVDDSAITFNNTFTFDSNEDIPLTVTIDNGSIKLNSDKILTLENASLTIGDEIGTGDISIKSNDDNSKSLTLGSDIIISPLSVNGALYVNNNNVTSESALSPTRGGTGQTTLAKGDILYANGTNNISKLPVGNRREVLTVSIDGVPNWEQNLVDPEELQAFAIAMAIALG